MSLCRVCSTNKGLSGFFREHRGQPLPSAALMSPMTRTFVATLENFVSRQGIPLVQFCPGQRKDAVMTEHLRHFAREEDLDLGRPEEIKLIFNRRIPRGMRAPFRTRIVTRDVTPSLNPAQ
jgi:hypothetical protein